MIPEYYSDKVVRLNELHAREKVGVTEAGSEQEHRHHSSA